MVVWCDGAVVWRKVSEWSVEQLSQVLWRWTVPDTSMRSQCRYLWDICMWTCGLWWCVVAWPMLMSWYWSAVDMLQNTGFCVCVCFRLYSELDKSTRIGYRFLNFKVAHLVLMESEGVLYSFSCCDQVLHKSVLRDEFILVHWRDAVLYGREDGSVVMGAWYCLPTYL